MNNKFMSNDCTPVTKKVLERFSILGSKMTYRKFLIMFVLILLVVEINNGMK